MSSQILRIFNQWVINNQLISWLINNQLIRYKTRRLLNPINIWDKMKAESLACQVLLTASPTQDRDSYLPGTHSRPFMMTPKSLSSLLSSVISTIWEWSKKSALKPRSFKESSLNSTRKSVMTWDQYISTCRTRRMLPICWSLVIRFLSETQKDRARLCKTTTQIRYAPRCHSRDGPTNWFGPDNHFYF